ncbi:MAG: hypothetical protein E7315_01895 [Clostridiales bacterium]|nr:hypothetical protein [Clostridiales bacterium]
MAKKKDITRNPPSIFEIAICLLMIIIMAFIAWQLVNIIGSSSEKFETCLDFQEAIKTNIEKWRLENNKSETEFPTSNELVTYFKNGAIPVCPDSTTGNIIALYNEHTGFVQCPNHVKIDVSITPTPAPTPAA